MMAKFNCVTYNCNGIGEKSKRSKIFTYLNDKLKHGFCFLQETHSTSLVEEKWKKEWGGDMYFSHGSSNSTGVAILFPKDFSVKVVKEVKDTGGRLIILETLVNDSKFLLINLYNANTEKDQLKVLDMVASKLDTLNIEDDCHTVFGGDFNLFFDSLLDCSGGNPTLKKLSIAKLMQILDKLDLIDIFRVRFPELKQFTFHRKNPLIRRRLDYLFTSNAMQELVDRIKILPSYMSDHSPIFMSVNLIPKSERGSYGWKFNNSLLADEKFLSDIRKHFDSVKEEIEGFSNPHIKWEYFKYQIRKFSIAFSILKKKTLEDERRAHEDIVKQYESSENHPSETAYAESKSFLESYYDNKTRGNLLRSRCEIYEQNEKSSKYFLNLEKRRGENGIVKKLVKNDTDLTDSKDILNELHDFYCNLFQRKIDKTHQECKAFLDTLQLPSISDEHKKDCDKNLTIADLENALFTMSIGKSPGNDGLSVEFYKLFWEDIKSVLFDSFKYSREVGELSASQRQAIIKLIEKRDKDKRYIQNWRPISLLNVDTKILSKCIAARFIPVLPTIISPDQTAYVKGRYIGESIRLISDILESSKRYNIPGFLLTVDLEKAFDSIDHIFLLACLEKLGFGPNFLCWVSILLNKNESCVANGGNTTQYFHLNRGARQGDPIAAFFFIIVVEVFFVMVRSNVNIKKLHILNFDFLLTAYADDTTFFVADIDSVKIIFNTFDSFSIYSGMKINQAKCELAGIGVKRSVFTALRGVKNIRLVDVAIRVLGVHFSYDSKLYTDRNFMDCIKTLQDVVRVWGMRLLSLYGKITSFKAMVFSKVICIASMSNIPNDVVKLVVNIHRNFIWSNKRPNIKHSTLISDYEKGGLKDIDIESKFKSLHLCWLKRLFDNSFHPWKQIPLFYINSMSSNSLMFLPNLDTSCLHYDKMPLFYQNIIKYWVEISLSTPKTPEMILSESLLYNAHLKIGNKPISRNFLGNVQNVFLFDIFDTGDNFISWESAYAKFPNLNQFKWIQIKKAIPPTWKKVIRNTQVPRDICCLDIHLNKGDKMAPLNCMLTKDLYALFIDKKYVVPTSQKYYENLFGPNLKWEKIYTLPRTLTMDSYIQVFQYKILHNALFLNERLVHCNYANTPLCSLCNEANESLRHLFCECEITQNLWQEITTYFSPCIALDPLTPQSALVGLFTENTDDYLLKNYIILLFKYCIYKYRNKTLNQYIIINYIKTNYRIEKNLNSFNKSKKFNNKWSKVIPLVQYQ